MKDIEISIENNSFTLLLLILVLSLFLFLELSVTLKTPISFGDEGFHTRMAQWIGRNTEYPVWRPFEGSNLSRAAFERPPVWNLLEASIIYLFGYSEIIIKILTPIIAFLTGISSYILIKRLFNTRRAFLSTIILMTIPSFVTYSILFYTDILFSFYFMMFFLTFLLYTERENGKYLILSSIFAGLSFLTKLPGVVIFLFIPIMFVYHIITKKRLYDTIKPYAIFLIILSLSIGGFLVRNLYYYGTPHCNLPIPFVESKCKIDDFESEFEFSGRTNEIGTETSLLRMGVIQYLEFAYGSIIITIFGLVCGLIALLKKGGKKNHTILLMMLLMLTIIMQSNIRAEDTARHTLAWTPIIAIIASKYFEDVYNFIKEYQKHIALIVFAIVLANGIINIEQKTTSMKQVKNFSPLFFEACEWMETNIPEDSLIATLWTHRTTYSAQRNVIGTFADLSLSKDVDYTMGVLNQHEITHIFIQKFSIDFQNRHLQEKYDWNFVQFLEYHPDNFEKIYENGPSLEQCIQQSGCDGNIIYEIKY